MMADLPGWHTLWRPHVYAGSHSFGSQLVARIIGREDQNIHW